MSNNKKKRHLGLNLILISSIISLNLLGISYAQWNDGINITTSISTGNIEPTFTQTSINKLNGTGDLSASLLNDYTIYLEGEVETDYEGTLEYLVINNGTIPVKYDGSGMNSNNNGIGLQLNQLPVILEPSKNDGQEKPTLNINAIQEGEYKFEFVLPFKQWNAE